ncbi:hypothetical protein [Streptomyces sp. NPDC056468]|uniref:hypothetical protein n=1 Tax=Streptomyces sp. NPDC056468 TaxID=3345830 RepID=UPI003691615C
MQFAASGLGALSYGIIEAPTRGWGDPLVLGMLGAAVLLIAALVLRERRVERPMLDMTLLGHRGFLFNTVAATLVTFILITDSESGVTRAAPTPITARAAITAFTSPASEPVSEPTRKIPGPVMAPPEPVAEQARGEHQRGEDDDVRVRHPPPVLNAWGDPQLPARGGIEVCGHRRQRHIEDRHVEAEREHARDEGPAPTSGEHR